MFQMQIFEENGDVGEQQSHCRHESVLVAVRSQAKRRLGADLYCVRASWQARLANKGQRITTIRIALAGVLFFFYDSSKVTPGEFASEPFRGPGSWYHVKRHAGLKMHLDSLHGQGLGGEATYKAPEEQEFAAIAAHRMDNKSLSMKTEDGKGRKKISKMQLCLGEACFAVDREVLSKAASICLHQDVRKMALQVRFSACTSPGLVVSKGLLGLAKLSDGTHQALLSGLTAIMDRFCDGNASLRAHIQKHVELLDTDAAADEVLASRLLRASAGMFANAKAQQKDVTHASRRLLSRPFAAIPEIKEVQDFFLLQSGSILKTINNSNVLQGKFRDFCKGRAMNMTFKMHRFNSMSKPASRFVLEFDAVLLTAIWGSIHRACPTCKEFLQFVDEKRLILFAMCTDVADEGMALTRLSDSESYDIAEMNLECTAFLSRLKYLFLEAAFDAQHHNISPIL